MSNGDTLLTKFCLFFYFYTFQSFLGRQNIEKLVSIFHSSRKTLKSNIFLYTNFLKIYISIYGQIMFFILRGFQRCKSWTIIRILGFWAEVEFIDVFSMPSNFFRMIFFGDLRSLNERNRRLSTCTSGWESSNAGWRRDQRISGAHGIKGKMSSLLYLENYFWQHSIKTTFWPCFCLPWYS